MLGKAKLFLFIGCLSMGFPMNVAAELTSLRVTDPDMLPSRWAATPYRGSNVSANAFLARNLIVNSQALRVTVNPAIPLEGFTFDVAIFNNQFGWDASSKGRIASVQYSASFIINSGIEFAPLLYQAGTIYVPNRHQQPSEFGIRQGLTDSLTIDQFIKQTGPGPAVPNFSPGASEIFFGLNARKQSFLGTGVFRFADFDLTATGIIPEPSSASLLICGLFMIGMSSRFTRAFYKRSGQ